MINRAWSKFTVKSVDDSKRIIEGIATTPSTDRAQDVVEPMGASFDLPMPFLWQHDSDQPVGHVIAAAPNRSGIPVTIKMAQIDEPGTLRDRLNEAWQSIKIGLVKGLSIGFAPIEHSYIEGGGIHFTKWNWLELSAVTIPANADASITAIKSADQRGPKPDSLEQLLIRASRNVTDPAARKVFRSLGYALDQQHEVMINHKERIQVLQRKVTKQVRVEYEASPTGSGIVYRKLHFADGHSRVEILTP